MFHNLAVIILTTSTVAYFTLASDLGVGKHSTTLRTRTSLIEGDFSSRYCRILSRDHIPTSDYRESAIRAEMCTSLRREYHRSGSATFNGSSRSLLSYSSFSIPLVSRFRTSLRHASCSNSRWEKIGSRCECWVPSCELSLESIGAVAVTQEEYKTMFEDKKKLLNVRKTRHNIVQ